MFDLTLYFVSKTKQINTFLNKLLEETENSSRIISAMKYSLMAGGKRIRPVLCMAAAEAVNGKGDNVLPAACAIEMIHTYSLIHDDLPAIDDDMLRRGKPTSHVAFDEPTAILAGDALLTLAFETLSSVRLKDKNNALKWLTIINMISQAAGYRGMIEGQMRDITSENVLLNLDELQKMHSLKTGALIEASVCCGALIEKSSAGQLECLKIYAKNIGLAFQVTDDILNVEGDPKIMGKAAGTDQLRKKNTYPSLVGINESRKFAGTLTDNALKALNEFDDKSDPLRAIAGYIIKRKK